MKANVEETVAEVLDDSGLKDHLIKLSSGVVLRAKQAPPLVLVKVLARFPRPNPPVYFNQQMGREMENPDDPDYIERLKAHRNESSSAISTAMIGLGTELESVPKGFPKPDSDEWLDEYQETTGLPVKKNSKSWRYLTWVSFKAVQNENDLQEILKEAGRLSGVSEDAVQAAETFSGGGKKR